ncbi:hypothetical protein IGI04_010331 [Brassica rapa subsp. trilocularis]|uniref:Reverse transcriptase zinc-binding domain-containing protein n=1 Tax=Brassica rapa subsp. trilocularis TaxID=1813537 RepID=A0ABQ7N017_BRACM|nr:hypothetical protein IGI04_010331 [Brassica rapa subsp. trilocularis]
MRGEVYTWIKMRVGNGVECRFWTDNWSLLGSLQDHFASTLASRQGIPPMAATLANLNRSGNWLLPRARSEAMIQVQVALTTMVLQEGIEDSYEWIVEGVASGKYKTSQVYWELKGEEAKVPWTKVVWTKRGIPKHSFLVWLVVLNRCPTRDRLLAWGLSVDSNCLLCNLEPESRDHLFFRCPFSMRVWSEVGRRCSFTSSPSWQDTINRLMALTGDRHANRLILLCWQAVIYFLWRERNQRLHSQRFQSSDMIISSLDRLIRDKILSYRSSSPSLSSSLMQRWFNTLSIPP